MNIFVAASYSSYVNSHTGIVNPEYKAWLEVNITKLESFGHTVFCALRADEYRINDASPGEAFRLDVKRLQSSDGLIALLEENVSSGVQTEIGYALGLNKKVILAHQAGIELSWFNKAIVKAGQANEVLLPLISDPFSAR
ncbi:MAG TPA: nucleoside 2-deoxyribosyltransferase [Candidatus Saccharimonadales bacterium]|nr:nucleoside 2-deoxyribosyltransferase [Candidatus Saccharimonadales bacterium]